ncbi:MAG TPA: hypothetical protein VEI47_09860 [Gemmatimonadales bacterium]|nr:hypothetical protein [Gemmatimonadales bacterium]
MAMLVPVLVGMRMAVHQVAVSMEMLVQVFVQVRMPVLVLMGMLALAMMMRLVRVLVRQALPPGHSCSPASIR